MAQQVFDQDPFTEHVANGATAVFAYSFQLLDEADLAVYRDGVKAATSDYTVSGVGNSSGGSITFSAMPAADVVVLLNREIALQRLTEYQTLGDFKAVVVNPDFNRLWQALQGQRAQVGGALRLPYPEQVGEIPGPADRALRILSFDAAGQVLMIAGVDASSAAALALDLASGSASKGSALVAYLASAANAETRTVRSKFGDTLSVMDFGAKADAVSDDTLAIQRAIDAAQLARCELYFPPPPVPGNYYLITNPLTVSGPIRIRGASPHGVQIIAASGSMSAGEYILDINCLAASNVEHSTIEGITFRSLDGVPNGIRVKNSSYVRIVDVRTFNVANAVDIDGSRCFSNKFDGLVCYGTTGTSVRFLPGFAGGGQFAFKDCTFTGAYGVTVDSTAATDGLTFDGCNWEGCTTRAVRVQGTVQGCNLEGVRGEGGSGSGFEFAPVSGQEVVGLSITGMSFYSGTVASVPVILGTSGGTGGRVRGFMISGNRVGYAATSYMVSMGAEVQSGVIAGNHLAENTPTDIIDVARLGVVVFSNEKGSGRLPEYWGTAPWGVMKTSYTGASTGHTVAQAPVVKGDVLGNLVTLTVPLVTGTSNATTFTITGMPTELRPAADRDLVGRVQDNTGSFVAGLVRIKTTGVIEVYATLSGGAFTSSGTKALGALSVSYPLA